MKLSIITVNYNNCAGLKKTIDSVLSQTWKDFEWIVIDGGSTDGCRELIEQHKECFSYWCSEPDKGVYNAMNKGIAHAKGEYLNFMNSGDVFYEPDTLGKVFSSEHTADMVYGDWVRVLSKGNVVIEAPKDPNIYYFYYKNICHQAMFIRGNILRATGYDERYKILADWAYTIRMIISGCKFEYTRNIICSFDAEDGLSENRTEALNKEVGMAQNEYPYSFRDFFAEYEQQKRSLSEYTDSVLLTRVSKVMSKGGMTAKLLHLCVFVINKFSDFIEKK